jgi:hypothetical protein
MRRFRNCLALSVFSLITRYTLGGHGLPSCTDVSSDPQHIFDFVVVGAGPGGGPLAARLAESGFSGMSAAISTPPLLRSPFFSHLFSSGCGCGTERGNLGRHYSSVLPFRVIWYVLPLLCITVS